MFVLSLAWQMIDHWVFTKRGCEGTLRRPWYRIVQYKTHEQVPVIKRTSEEEHDTLAAPHTFLHRLLRQQHTINVKLTSVPI
eukprot:COSAG06_NODE_2169_length_7418_cov_25.032108_3_plen_82_part_00